MPASEKLKALEKGHLRTYPLFRGTAVDEGGSGFLRARDIEAVMDALPQIVAVVEAAELLVTEAKEIIAPEYPSTLKSYRAAHAALTALERVLDGE